MFILITLLSVLYFVLEIKIRTKKIQKVLLFSSDEFYE